MFMKKVFVGWLIDIPFILMWIFVLFSWRGIAATYRLFSLRKYVTKILEQTNKPNQISEIELEEDIEQTTTSMRRWLAFLYFAAIFIDIVCFCFCKDENLSCQSLILMS